MLIPSLPPTSSNHNHLPKAMPPNTVTSGVRASGCELGDTLNPQHESPAISGPLLSQASQRGSRGWRPGALSPPSSTPLTRKAGSPPPGPESQGASGSCPEGRPLEDGRGGPSTGGRGRQQDSHAACLCLASRPPGRGVLLLSRACADEGSAGGSLAGSLCRAGPCGRGPSILRQTLAPQDLGRGQNSHGGVVIV